jgi:hypothetical protein
MIGLFSSIDNVANISKTIHKTRIDNFASFCQYRITTTFLVVFTIFVCANNFIGNPMECVQSSVAIPENVLNTYCFFIGKLHHCELFSVRWE